jgi:hypothetical protein
MTDSQKEPYLTVNRNKNWKKFFTNIFWYLLGLCTTGLLFENLKKVEYRVRRTLVKVVYFSKMTSSSKTPPFWILEKSSKGKVR